MGNIASALTTAEALTRWAPRLVVLVGIAGGIAGRVRVGDLVVADRVFDYEAAKATLFRLAPHGVKFLPSFDGRQRIMTWSHRTSIPGDLVPQGGPTTTPRILQAGYASGEKVVASRWVTRRVARQDRKIAAIDMESLGVADACRREGVEHLIIKAITDLADRRKTDDYRAYCCALASRVLVRLLADRILLPPRLPDERRSLRAGA
jgi:nucleoside phosphorylase